MEIKLETPWRERLEVEWNKPYFQELLFFVEEAYRNNEVYPPADQIFSAFNHCSFEDCKVVILGQDPYHGLGQANGLSFSVRDGIRFPPSLNNIFKEIHNDLGLMVPVSGNLERWADQGVLLLNATLTVEQGMPGSHHKKGWERFTDEVIRYLSEEKENLVFLLWGKYAQKKGAVIDTQRHYVLEANHPSPMSANMGGWFGNQHFSKTNIYLEAHGLEPIQW